MNGPITTEETYHISNILKHYAHAKEKHPYFCDRLLPNFTKSEIRSRASDSLRHSRLRIKAGVRNHNLMWNEIADCEVWKATEAMANGNTARAIEELYDCIAVCLRTIDVLEGRQELGKSQTISGNNTEK